MSRDAERLDDAAPWANGTGRAAAAPARWLPAAAAALLLVPLFVARGAPMTDLPLHEGMVSLLAHWGDPAFTRGLYELHWGHANQLFYALALPFAFVVGSDLACRIVVAAAVGLIFAGTARLCDHVGASRWAALLVAPVAMGWTFFLGFVSNLLGIGIFLLALPALDRFAQRPTWRRALAGAAIVVLLHAAHETSVACVALAIVVLSVGQRARLREWLLRAAPLAVAVLLVLFEMHTEKPVLTALARRWSAAGVQTIPVAAKVALVFDFLMGFHGIAKELGVMALVAGALATCVSARRRTRRRSPEPPEEAFLVHLAGIRFQLLALALFGAYLAAPYSINFGAHLYVRFLAPAYAVAVVVLARGDSLSRTGAALCAAVPVAWLAVVLPQFALADRERRAVDTLAPQIDEGSAVAVLGYGDDPVFPYAAVTAGNRALAVRGGRALHSFAEYPIAPVVMRAGVHWDEEVLRVYQEPSRLEPAWDLTRFRYLLLRVSSADRTALAPRVARALAPDARLVATAGAWSLFASTRPVVPIDAPDESPPAPAPPTLAELLSAGPGAAPERRP